MPANNRNNTIENDFTALLNLIFEPVIILNKEGKILEVNQGFEETIGFEKEQIVGKKVLKINFLDPINKAILLENLERGINRRNSEPFEMDAVSKNGQTKHFEVRGKKTEYSGEPVDLFIFHEITGRIGDQEIEQSLRESEERFRAISNSVMDAIILADDEGKIAYWNPAAERMFGCTREEAVEIEAKSLFVPQRFHKGLEKGMKQFRNGDLCEFFGKTVETVGLRKDGTEFPIELSGARIQISGKAYAVAIAKDITEQKRMQKKLSDYSEHLKTMVDMRTLQLRDANERLVKSERLAAIGELAGMIGHDLRNPLAGIRGATYYLKTKYAAGMADDGKKMLKTIDDCINHSDKIINDLLDYSREIRLDLTKTTPEQLVQKALSLVEVPEKIRIMKSTQDMPTLKADTEKIVRVFINIIKNACDAMANGGCFTIKNERSQNKIVFTFVDTGPGIAKEVLNKLWTPLFTTKAKGMGFGLPICKRLVEAHGGTISMESTLGKGTTVTVTIPVNPKPTGGGEEIWVFNKKSLSSMMTPQ
jgi:PAS domain S-box-containing protein